MTQEEKVRRYDEAIKKAESLYKAAEPMSGCNVIIETLFPELAESEDERIRKALVEMVHDTTGDNLWVDYNVHKEDALAWLEKQEQHKKFRDSIQVGDKVTRNEDGVLVNLSQLNRVAKKDEKQGEQKPAWSEEDEVMIKIFDSIIRYIVEVVDKDVLERFGTKREKLFSWLKSLKDRVQPKQEWSEEEEENFKKAIRVLKVNNFHHTADMLQEMKYKLIPREKANWKPSDEQMKTLQEVIDVGYFTSYPNSLETLYEQLKKLKGE